MPDDRSRRRLPAAGRLPDQDTNMVHGCPTGDAGVVSVRAEVRSGVRLLACLSRAIPQSASNSVESGEN